MVLYSQLPIYRDSYLLLLQVYKETALFNRDVKYTLGQDMKRDCLNMFRELYNANISVEKRVEHLDNFIAAFEMLRIEFRLCVDLGVLSVKKLAQISLLMDNVSKQATSWRKKYKNMKD